MTEDTRLQLARVRTAAFLVGGVGLVASVLGLLLGAVDVFFQSYLFAFTFWAGLGIGSLTLLMVHHLTRGKWGFPVQRPLEAGALLIPVFAVLFVPLVFGLDALYEWSHPEAVAEDELLQHKAPYLNDGGFILRSVVYFALWSVWTFLLVRWSSRLDTRTDLRAIKRMQAVSGPGLVLMGFTVTFASVDWLMSLEPHWFSSIYGLLLLIDFVLLAHCIMILLVCWLGQREPLSRLLTTQHYHDLGNFLLAFVCLWAYLSFMQYIIIWSANLPEDIIWYLHRTRGGWEVFAVVLMAFHFALPFFILLIRRSKQRARTLAIIAAWVLLMRVVDTFWLVIPAFHQGDFYVHILHLTLLLGIGGVTVGVYLVLLLRREILPRHDPRIEHELGIPTHDLTS